MKPKIVLVMVDIAHEESSLTLLSYVRQNFEEATIHVSYVMPYGYYSYVEPFVSKESQAAAAERARQHLSALLTKSGLEDAAYHVLRGGIGEQVVLEASSIKADLVVINATRLDSHHTTLGTHAAQIARHCGCSVLLHRAPTADA
ncbi:MAG: universal stress protein [Maritimibacter sp.]|jgi:universal stress protein F